MMVSIIATTYFEDSPIGASRFDSCWRTVESWARYLKYDLGGVTLLLVNKQGHAPLLDKFRVFESSFRVLTLSDGGGGVGQALNIGFWESFKHSMLTLYAADDWALTAPFDLTPWARLLTHNESIGMVRLGPPHPHLTGTVLHLPDEQGGWALKLDRHHYAFGHRPALYHKRMIDTYGLFPEGQSPLECERLYYEHVNATPGPDIVLALPHPWKHVGEYDLAYTEP